MRWDTMSSSAARSSPLRRASSASHVLCCCSASASAALLCASTSASLLLAALRSRGLIAEGQGGHEEGPHDKSATWLGVWCGAPSPCARRLDIKVYPHQQLPTALSYFTGPAVLSRALRYWCNTPCAEVSALAAALHPRGNAFTLNDSELEVVHVHPWVQGVARRERREALGVLVACRSETELMQAVGLSYVPPHMRQLLEELVGS
mmetsp:Transcript_33183/g.73356  ORF Transcript_33183/g.73356 Transcript_33183/m.73356 type:complete len:206 (-) Transcript_33183:458-1075(-)